MAHVPFCTASDYLRILYPDGDLLPVIQYITLTVFDHLLLAFTFCLFSEGCIYLRYLFLIPSMDGFIDPFLFPFLPLLLVRDGLVNVFHQMETVQHQLAVPDVFFPRLDPFCPISADIHFLQKLCVIDGLYVF